MFGATWARACKVHKRKIVKSLYVISYGLPYFLDCLEEFVHGHLGIIFVESRKKSGFYVYLRIDGAIWKAPEPVKGYPLKGTDE